MKVSAFFELCLLIPSPFLFLYFLLAFSFHLDLDSIQINSLFTFIYLSEAVFYIITIIYQKF